MKLIIVGMIVFVFLLSSLIASKEGGIISKDKYINVKLSNLVWEALEVSQ